MIALDTHALVWYAAEPARIPAKARRLLEAAVRSKEHIAVSSICAWEIAMLVARGRLELTIDAETWIAHVQEPHALRVVRQHQAIAVDHDVMRDRARGRNVL